MNVNSNFPSYKELRDILSLAQKGNENRIIQINYASGLRTVIEQECSQLKLSRKVIPYSMLRKPSVRINEDSQESLWGSIVKKTASFLIGLNPFAGAALFVTDLAVSTTKYYLKRSEIALLKGTVGIHSRKRKKYQSLRNIVIVSDLSELSQEDYEYVTFLALLIRDKYITRTLLVVFQNQGSLLLQLPENQYVYSLNLTAEMIQKYLNSAKQIDPGTVEIINLVGIQYLEIVCKMIDCNNENDKSVERLIGLMLEKLSENVSVNKSEIDSFLKVCSLLFERFCLFDIENTSPFQAPKYEKLLTQCMESKLLRAFIPDAPLEYAFVENFIREYYRGNPSIIFTPQVYKRIFDYLKSTYPQNYTDIALLSGFVGFSKHVVLSYYIIAYYHDKFTAAQHKKQKVVNYLQSDIIGECLIRLENYNRYIIDTPKEIVLGQCYILLEEILAQQITLESKLCALNIIATLVYEMEGDDNNRMKVMNAYQELLVQSKIFNQSNPAHYEYAADAVLFSTCIDNNYQTAMVAQRLIEQLDLSIKGNNAPVKFIRLFRLGNALYPTDIAKGLEFTKKAYILSKDLIIEHELARINYSASLIVSGEYKAAAALFHESDFSYSVINYSTELSVENNRLIAEYFSSPRTGKRALYQGFKKLFDRLKSKESSDINIVKNNYVSACLVANKIRSIEQLERLCQEIESSGDPYHIFFAAQNRLVLYYLTHDKDKFIEIQRKVTVPSLMRAYENFFTDKAIFMHQHFGEFQSIEKLHQALSLWAERYPEQMFVHFVYPVSFGLIERWFE